MLEAAHELHLVSLAGFAGMRPVEPPLIPRWRNELAEYAARLDRPVIVGHSLGGSLSLAIGQHARNDVAAVVTVHGYPDHAAVLLPERTAEERHNHALIQAKAWGAKSELDFVSSLERSLVTMMNGDPCNVLRDMQSSDRQSVGQVMLELFALRVEGDLGVPVMALLPELEMRTAQFQAMAGCELHHIADAKHFIMLDQPKAVATLVRDFAKRVL